MYFYLLCEQNGQRFFAIEVCDPWEQIQDQEGLRLFFLRHLVHSLVEYGVDISCGSWSGRELTNVD